MYVYIYIYICYIRVYTIVCGPTAAGAGAFCRRRENMVGVNMVLAESVKFKHGLHKSCGMEWFEGTMLEPCLLQPW